MKKVISVFTAVAIIATFSFATTVWAVDMTQATNAAGETLFEDLPFGEYEILVTRDGFYSATATVTIIATEAGKDVVIDVELEPITKGKVIINIEDESGNVVNDADVKVNGGVDFDNLEEGTHFLTIEKDGYYNETIGFEIEFIEGREIYEANVRLRAITDGTATVTILDGVNPVSGVRVTVNGTDVITDADGNAVFENLPIGTHEITAYKDGYLTATGSITVAAKNGQDNHEVTINLEIITTGSVRVIVKDTAGNPLQGAAVEIRSMD